MVCDTDIVVYALGSRNTWWQLREGARCDVIATFQRCPGAVLGLTPHAIVVPIQMRAIARITAPHRRGARVACGGAVAVRALHGLRLDVGASRLLR
jgi:hypothetical protein